MKKLLMLIVVGMIALTSSAQVEAGFRGGIQANFGMTNVLGEGDDASFGYGVGVVVEYNINPNLFLQSGLAYQSIAHTEGLIEGTLRGNFLQLPIHIGYRFNLGTTSSIFIQAGPTFGVGLFGSTIEWNNGGSDEYFDLMKRFDLGVGGRLGVEFSKIQISVGVNYGVLEAASVDGYHNFSASLGIGYMF